MKFINTPFKLQFLILLCSFTIYFFHFHSILLHLNTVLSGVNGDTLKNYFTYLYNIKNDAHFLEFTGQNYPFGEHVTFVDCQPLLTFILRLLPFTHNYLIGILHGLIFLSFIITPLIFHKIFLRLKIDPISSFFIAIGITVLSPQYIKILAGHFALAYTCIIPFCILLLIKFFQERTVKNLCRLFFLNLELFFLHPYLGIGSSVFCLLTLFIFEIFTFSKKTILFHTLQNAFAGIFPIILFRLFISLTDTHIGRSEEPQNVNVLISNTGGLVLPNFGPLRDVLPKIFRVQHTNFEGYGYLGIALIVLTLVSIVFLPLVRKKLTVPKEILVIFISAVLFIIPAFGLHNDLLNTMHLKIAAVDQFRATGRLIWFFYYTLPVFLFVLIYHSLKNYSTKTSVQSPFRLLAFCYVCFNLWESSYLFTLDKEAYWVYRNIFNEKCLSAPEKNLIEKIKKTKFQAILPLPLYATGSDVYQRLEAESMLYSMMYAYHCGLPVLSAFTSRTSVPETEEVIGSLNAYKTDHRTKSLIKGKGDFLVLRSRDALLPDEERLYSKTQSIYRDSLMEASVLKEDMLFKKVIRLNSVQIAADRNVADTVKNIIYLKHEDRKPFVTASFNDYETIYSIAPDKIAPGTYIVSLHYYYAEKTFSSVSCNMIINRESEGKSDWFYNTMLKCFSGFYNGYAVFEDRIKIDKHTKYDFMLKGVTDGTYRISDFMLRPEEQDVLIIKSDKNSIINNFPER